MIKKLDHTELETAKIMQSVFYAAYSVEAELLRAKDFPPLKRPLESYVNSPTEFFGYQKNQELAGVIEIDHNSNRTYINSLVVDPKFFRQGIAHALMTYVIDVFDSNLYVVETGLDNGPATALYIAFGFKIVKEWDTNHSIRKIKLELQTSP